MNKKIGDGQNVAAEVAASDLAASTDTFSGESQQAAAQAFPEGAKPEPHKIAKKVRPGVDDAIQQGDDVASGQDGETEQAASGGASDSPTVVAQASPAATTPETATGTAGSEGAAAGEQAMGAGAGGIGGAPMGMLAAGAAVAAAAAGGGGGAVAATVAVPVLFTLTGRVADGYVRGAKIFVDANHNGVADASEDTGAVTDAQGNFSLQTALQGSIIAVGGTNIDTGLANTMVLKAPAGSTAINPLTTVLQQYSESHPTVSLAAAQAAVNTALGIPAGINLTTYDPLAAASPTDPVALAVQKIAAEIVATSTLSGGNDLAVINSIVALVDQGHFIDLTQSSVLTTVYAGLSGVNQALVLAVNSAINEVTTLATTGPGSLTATEQAAFNGQNDAPVFISGPAADVDENAAVGTAVYVANANDLEGSNVTYSLLNNAGGKFAINPTTGQVTVAGPIDFEATPSLQITVVASDGALTSSETVTITVHDVAETPVVVPPVVNHPPVFSSGVTASVRENLGGTVVYHATATDADGTALTYSLSGDDAALFSINATTGAVTLLAAVDFEAPNDANHDDVYNITVSASDGVNTAAQNVAISIVDANALPFAVSFDGSGLATVTPNLSVGAGGFEYSTDGGLTFTPGTGSSFTIAADSDLAGNALQVRETYSDGAKSDPTSSYSALTVGATGSSDVVHTNLLLDNSVGGISVHASGLSADAVAHISSVAGTVGLNNSAIEITASGQSADAGLRLSHAQGSIASVNITATSDDASAYARIRVDGTVGSITLDASGDSADVRANVGAVGGAVMLTGGAINVTADGVYSDAHLHLAKAAGSIGDIMVAASGTSSEASADISSVGGTVSLASSHISVIAGVSADAELSLSNVRGSISSLEVTADRDGNASADIVAFGGTVALATGIVLDVTAGDNADAELKLTNATGSIGSLNVLATSQDATASANISGHLSDVGIGEITVSASGHASNASADLSASSVGSISVHAEGRSAGASANIPASGGTVSVAGSVIDISASGVSAEADLHLQNATGSIASLSLSAVSSDASALASIGLAGAVGSVSLSAGAGAQAEADVVQSVFGGSVTVAGDGHTTLVYTAETAQTVSIAGRSSDAEFDLVVDHPDADFAAASPDLTADMMVVTGFHAASNGGGDLIGLGNGATHFTENSADAGSVSAFLAAAQAALDSGVAGNNVYFGVVGGDGYVAYDYDGSGITGVIELAGVTNLDGADIFQHLNNLSFADEIASIASSSHIDSLSVTDFSAETGPTIVNVQSDGSVGDITVRSASCSADAQANVSSAGGTVTMDDSDIVVSGWARADAELHLSNATGNIASLIVTMDDNSNHASSLADIQTDGSIGNIAVHSRCGSADAQANISAASAGGAVTMVSSDISVTATRTNGGGSPHAELHLADAVGTITSLNISADVGMAQASATIDLNGSIENLHLHAVFSAEAEADIAQTAFGGTVTVDGDGHTVLQYTAETAQSVSISGRSSGAEFDLVVSRADADLSAASSADAAVLTGNMMVVTGLAAASSGGHDLISLGSGAVHFTENSADAGSLAAFLTAAQASLESDPAGGNVYFGVVGGDGYLAYDYDGSGITGVIELTGVINLDGTDFFQLQPPAPPPPPPAIDPDALTVENTGSVDASSTLSVTDAHYSDILVTATDTYTQAELHLSSATGDFGSLTVKADGNFAMASADVVFSTSGTLGDVVVKATSGSADAELRLSNASGSIASLNFSAEAGFAIAHGEIRTDGSIGDVKVQANGDSSDAQVNISASSIGGTVTMVDSDITVEANGRGNNPADGTVSELQLLNASGSIASLTVCADATFNVATANIQTDGSVGAIRVHSGCGSTDAQASISAASAGGTVTMASSDITVIAQNSNGCRSSDAGLQLSDAMGSIQSLTVSADTGFASAHANISISGSVGDITLRASANSTDAQASISSASGTVTMSSSDISVSAQGASSNAELHLSNAAGSIDSLSVTANCGDVAAHALAEILTDGSVGNISVQAQGTSSDAEATVSAANVAGSVTMTGGCVDVIAGSNFSDAELQLSTATGTIASVIVGACGASSDAGLNLSIDGSVGGILVQAGARSADAEATVSAASVGGSVTLTAGCVDVMASGTSSDAELHLSNAMGSISSLDVSATGTHATAIADINGTVTIGSIDVTASATSSVAELHLSNASGSIDSLSVTASCGDAAQANAEILTDGSVGSISVQAQSGSSDATASISAASTGGTVTMTGGSVDVMASGTSSDAELHLSNASGSISSLDVNASAAYASAIADVNTDGSVGSISVSASHESADAQATISAGTAGGTVTMVSSDISVTAVQISADAELHLSNATGYIQSLSVEAGDNSNRSGHASANADIQTDGSIGDIGVRARCGSADAQATISAATAGGQVTLVNSDIQVIANAGNGCSSADAQLQLSNATGSIASLTVSADTLTATANADIHTDGSIGNISVLSACHSTDAQASISAATAGGHVTMVSSDISVVSSPNTSSCQSMDAGLQLSNATGTINSLNVSAEAADSVANADIHLNGSLGAITVSASGESSDAQVTITSSDAGGTVSVTGIVIDVTASGRSADAELHLSNAVGSIQELNVSADGEFSHANAIVSIDGNVTSLIVSADGEFSSANAVVSVHGDIASLVLSASGDASGANATVNVNGSVGAMTVIADASGASALSSVSVTGALNSVTLFASCDARAEADIDQAFFGGSVTVNGHGNSTLVYTAETAATVNLGGRSNDAQFDLVVHRADADLTAADVTAVSADLMVVTGFRTSSDVVGLNNGALHFTSAGSADAGSLSAFLNDASAALSTGVAGSNMFFELVNGQGYLAYDYDGTGVTGVMKLAGVTSLGSNDFVRHLSLTISADTTRTISTASIIDSVSVDASGRDVAADLTFTNAVYGAGATISVDASDGHTASLHLSGVTGSVASVSLDASQGSTASASISQTVFGGSVTVTGIGHAALQYTGETANSVDLAGRSFTGNSADAVFDLTMHRADADLAGTGGDAATLAGSTMILTGFNPGRDSISLDNGVTHFSENTADAGSVSAFLAAADTALSTGVSGNDVYFGVVGGDGYVAYDYDGSGITGVIELAGVTSVDPVVFASHESLSFNANAAQTVTSPVIVDSLTVDASQPSQDVSVDLSFADARVIGITVTSSGVSSDAELNLSNGPGLIGALIVSTDSENAAHAVASANILTDGRVGDISVYAYSEDAHANVSVSGSTVTMTDSVIVVSAGSSGSNVSADAELHLSHAAGSIASVTVSADAGHDTANADIQTDGSVGNIRVHSGCLSSDAQASISAANVGGTVTMVSSDINVIASSSNNCGSTDAEFHLSNAVGDINSLNVVAGTRWANASADISIDGSIGPVQINATGTSSDASAHLHANSVGSIGVSVAGSATANLALDVAGSSGPISVTGAGTANISYVGDQHPDTIDLSGFTGSTHLTLEGADADTVDWAQLEANMLHVIPLDSIATGLDLNVSQMGSGAAYLDDSATPVAHLTDFEANASVALTTNQFYFGVVTDTGNGYLAYDFNHTGVTGVIEMAGVTDFDPTKIQNVTV
jgi:hypothetical protein